MANARSGFFAGAQRGLTGAVGGFGAIVKCDNSLTTACMKVAILHNLKPQSGVAVHIPEDEYEESDSAETIDAIASNGAAHGFSR